MTMLQIEGLALPVMIDSLAISGEMVGTTTRNQRGHRMLERRRQKWELDFTLAPRSLAWAQLYRALLLGEGEFFDTQSAYGSKGYLLAGTGSLETGVGGNPIYGNGCFQLTTGETLTVPGEFYTQAPAASGAHTMPFGATFIAWRRRVTAATYQAVGFSWRRYDTTATVKREALGNATGLHSLTTAGAFTGPETFAVNSSTGALTITNPNAETLLYSMIRVVPWYLASEQIDALILGRNHVTKSFPKLPKVFVETDLLSYGNMYGTANQDNAVMIAHGDVDSMAVQPSMQAGVYDPTTTGLSCRLYEV